MASELTTASIIDEVEELERKFYELLSAFARYARAMGDVRFADQLDEMQVQDRA
jgi:hypothetical protein